MLNAGIVGVTGYAGQVLLYLLLKHPSIKITHVSAQILKPTPISKIYPQVKNHLALVCDKPDIKEIIRNCDLVFLALPHTVSMEIAPVLLKAGKTVIDLSADYRFKDAKIYEKFYQVLHIDKAHLKYAVYGLPEIYRNRIRSAKLIANPGCYPTAAILALAPLVACDGINLDSLIIDAKSGLTGAGRAAVEKFISGKANQDFKAYKVNVHQHAPEINQQLSKLAGKKIKVTFVPHLLPVERGILETIYIKRNQNSKLKNQNLIKLYKNFYKGEKFVRIRQEGDFPSLKDVVGTNFCDIGIKQEVDQVIIIVAIDNLVKGASGQAVQNMNIMYKFPESAGLL